ncbi:MAG: dihydroneopterin aldolase [Frankiales bacterium]|nr:dihydroneopterin aldolase [Frankiales bacterium]
MTDRIALRGLTLRGHHGVLPEERRDGQRFVVDVVLEVDTAPAAATDDLSQTVDYAELADRLAAVVTGEPVDLLETLADRLAATALDLSPLVQAVEVAVHKPEAPVRQPVSDVVVTVRRDRSAAG